MKSLKCWSTSMIGRNVLMQVAIGVVALGPFATSVGAQTARSLPQPPAKSKPASAQAAAQAAPPETQGLSASSAKPDDVIARVGNANLSGEEIRAYVAGLAPREQAALAQDPALLSQAVRSLLANRLVLQEVLARKWDQQPTVVAQLARVRESALVELYLQSVSTPPADFPSDEEVQKVYEANRGALLVPRQFQLAQIFVAVPKGADKAAEDGARKTADDLQRKLKGGADFAALANENGERNGGELGWLAESQIRPEIRGQVLGLMKNAISEPLKLDDGWHLIKLIDTKASYTRTLPEVRDQLVQQIRAERANVLRRAYLAELLRKTPPAINELALSKILGNPNR